MKWIRASTSIIAPPDNVPTISPKDAVETDWGIIPPTKVHTVHMLNTTTQTTVMFGLTAIDMDRGSRGGNVLSTCFRVLQSRIPESVGKTEINAGTMLSGRKSDRRTTAMKTAPKETVTCPSE